MNKSITLMVVSDRKGVSRKLTLKTSWIKLGAIFGIVLCVLFAALVTDYLGLVVTTNENKRLKLENSRLEDQFVSLENKLTNLESELEGVRTFSTKLRSITEVDAQDRIFNLRVPSMNHEHHFHMDRDIASIDEESSNAEINEDIFLKSPILDKGNRELSLSDGKNYSVLSVRLSKAIDNTSTRRYELMELWGDLSQKQSLMKSTPSISPSNGWISSGFGYRASPQTGHVSFHYGIDIAASEGAPVRAAADGMVSFIGYDPGYGKLISIDHGYGVMTRYGHNSLTYVVLNQRVKRGDVIAAIGSTGRSTGPHLHYEVRVHGIPVDPKSYLLE